MTSITFSIPGPIIPWARARRKGKRYFVAREQKAYRNAIAWECKRIMLEEGIRIFEEGPVSLIVVALYKRPKKHAKMAELPDFKVSRGDLDNLIKQCGDSLIGVAYKDDAQVSLSLGSKNYHDLDTDLLVVTVEELE